MEINDKHHILKNIHVPGEMVLELGCGSRKHHKDAVGIDILDYDDVDIQGDVHSVLKEIPDNRIAAVYAYHFFEHVDDLKGLIREIERILQNDGRLEVVVPHFSNPYFYSDYTHTTHFGLYSFSYFARDDIFSRKVPRYQERTLFILEEVGLVFKSPRPFYIRWAIKKTFQFIFNLNTYLKELYEEFFCYLVPCYEIRYTLRLQKE